MRLGYIKDESGKLIRKFIREDEIKENPDVLFRVSALFGNYMWTDEEHMEEAKEAFLEQVFNLIRELAKRDEFWIVKKPSDWENEMHPLLGTKTDAPQEAKDGKSTIGWQIHFPQMEGYYPYDVAEQIQTELDACCRH